MKNGFKLIFSINNKDSDSDFVAQGSQQTLVTVAAPPRQNIEPRQARAQVFTKLNL